MLCRTVALVAGLLFLITAIGPATETGEKPGDFQVVMRFKMQADTVYAAAYSPDGKLLVTASRDKTLKLWDAATGNEIKTYGGAGGHTNQVISVAFSDDGTMIASGSTDNTVKVWDVPRGTPIRSMKADKELQSVALSPDGLKLAIGGAD